METHPTLVTMPTPASLSPVARMDPSADRLVRVLAVFQLTESGRKTSLLAGGNGRAMQQVTLEVPGSRLHLVTVDAEGVARLKLRPHYTLDAQQRIVRNDASPTYDILPTPEDLLRDAAKNHQLERAYFAERMAEKEKRRELSREFREQVAREFLADPERRALPHPPPTPQRCDIPTLRGRLRFDVARDDGEAHRVPAEAHRRFRSDLRARAEEKRRRHDEQIAVAEEKKRFLAEWVATRCTPEQQARYAAGALPVEEVLESMADEVFAPLAEFPRYVRDGAERLQAHLRQYAAFRNIVVQSTDLSITVAECPTPTQTQWRRLEEVRRTLPTGVVSLRAHRISLRESPAAPAIEVFGARIKAHAGPFTVVRELAMPESPPPDGT